MASVTSNCSAAIELNRIYSDTWAAPLGQPQFSQSSFFFGVVATLRLNLLPSEVGAMRAEVLSDLWIKRSPADCRNAFICGKLIQNLTSSFDFQEGLLNNPGVKAFVCKRVCV